MQFESGARKLVSEEGFSSNGHIAARLLQICVDGLVESGGTTRLHMYTYTGKNDYHNYLYGASAEDYYY